jgi:hypothetical protein
MTTCRSVALVRIGVLLCAVCAVGFALTFGLARAASPAPGTPALPCRDGGDRCLHIGFTEAWFDGQTVQLGYSHDFFCAPPKSGALSGCEAGAPATTQPPSGPVVSNVYLLIPVGFSPPAATLHCPVPGQCIDHPATIDLSRLVGDQGKNTILPAHSLVIEDEEAFQSTWWPMVQQF